MDCGAKMFHILQFFALLFTFSKGTENTGCDPGWVVWESTCYHFSDTVRNKDDAQVACAHLGAQLAKVTSMQENQFITQQSNDTLMITRDYWVQGSDANEENIFIFEDSTPITFFLWYASQPDDDNNQDCILLIHIFGGRQWFDRGCETENYYICETAKEVMITPERCGRYRRSYGVPGTRISDVIRCGVICDRTVECVGYTDREDGSCMLLTAPCTTFSDIPCFDRSLP